MHKSTAAAEPAVAVAAQHGWGRHTAAPGTDHPEARETPAADAVRLPVVPRTRWRA